jgi:hypothetical protein
MKTKDELRRQLLTYLAFAEGDVKMGRPLGKTFVAALWRWGKARTDQIDRLNAIQLVPVVEKDGFTGDERFAEVARRLERFRGKDPDERLIRKWWETRKKLGARSLLEDDVLNRPVGRPPKPKA